MDSIDDVTCDYWSALFMAIFNRNDDIAKDLIAAGANVNNIQDDSQLTPLHMACSNGNIEIVRLLLEAGADIGARDNNGHTSRYFAVSFGFSEEIVNLLETYETFPIKEPDCM